MIRIAFSFGISIMTLAYSIGHITGGHMNPGVSFLMFLRRQMSGYKMICYWGAQLLGAVLGSSLMWGCVNNLAGEIKVDGTFQRPPFDLGATVLDPTITIGNGFLLELMGSFFFFFVIAQTALDKRGIAESFFPAIPIGFSLIIVHICLIPFTGCGVNPARTFGPSMVVCMAGGDCAAVMQPHYWIYYAGPLIAAWGVSEITILMNYSWEDEDSSKKSQAQTIGQASKTPENQALQILNESVNNGSLKHFAHPSEFTLPLENDNV